MTSPTLIDDCFRPGQSRLSHGAALELLRTRTAAIAAPETVSLEAASGRVLAADVIAPRSIPLHTNAAVDGFAVRWTEKIQKDGGRFRVIGRAAAGHSFQGHVGDGEAIQILTGAVVPDDVDCIVMQEDVSPHENDGGSVVDIPSGTKPNANIRPAGEDVTEGGVLFRAGHVVRPPDIAALASAGCGTIRCYRRLRVGIVSTGDEIVPADGRDITPGQVFDSNSPMLRAAVVSAGCEVTDYGIWPDDGADVRQRLSQVATECDVVLTSGGASQGQEDHMAAAIDGLGQRHLWQLAIKPGRPLMFGQIGQTVVVGLPGNPVAVFVCYLMYVFPLLRQLSGSGWPVPKVYSLPADFEVTKRKLGRREFWRASLEPRADGSFGVVKFPNDGSGLLSGLRVADGLVDVPEDLDAVRRGDLVRFIPFSQYGSPERVAA
ncbi:MAG: gephyrin-like molybdotransferase Glp [Pseudomonadota bacterium]